MAENQEGLYHWRKYEKVELAIKLQINLMCKMWDIHEGYNRNKMGCLEEHWGTVRKDVEGLWKTTGDFSEGCEEGGKMEREDQCNQSLKVLKSWDIGHP